MISIEYSNLFNIRIHIGPKLNWWIYSYLYSSLSWYLQYIRIFVSIFVAKNNIQHTLPSSQCVQVYEQPLPSKIKPHKLTNNLQVRIIDPKIQKTHLTIIGIVYFFSILLLKIWKTGVIIVD